MPNDKPKQKFSLVSYDDKAFKATEVYIGAVDRLYNQVVSDFSKLASNVTPTGDKLFSFSNNQATKAAADKITANLASSMQVVISGGVVKQWLSACDKGDSFLKSILDPSKLDKEKLAIFQNRNLEALKGFQDRKINGLGLSDRIWNYTGQMKTQMELGIDIALGDGRSAAQLSRDLRQYLVDPDKLFRRVRDKHGNLVLSKNAKAFHPGQGKYRSSYKNAMRLTRTEINMAYRESDQLRWQQLDFVLGYEVKLSNNHTLNGVPFKDICDDLKGKYPKKFKFSGWHPQCRCHIVPIMKDMDDVINDLNLDDDAINDDYSKYQNGNITDVPDGFKDWVKNNAERSEGWKSQPFFIRDNYKDGMIKNGYDPFFARGKAADKPAAKVKPIKTEAQKQAIQKRWDERLKANEQVSKMVGNVLNVANQYPEITDELIAPLKAATTNAAKRAEANKLSLEIAAIKKEERRLSILLDDVKSLKSQFGLKATQDLFLAVESKLNTWDGLPLDQLKKKLEFEIKWVEENKKYITWEGSKRAYNKKLATVNYHIEKNTISESITDAIAYAKTTKSPKVKLLVTEFEAMAKADTPLSVLKAKAADLNSKVEKLIKDNAAKKLKNLPKIDANWGDPSNYTKARKDGALWAKTVDKADAKLRDNCGAVWQAATQAERDAAYYYTHTYSSINEPLRGIPYFGEKSLAESKSKVPHLTSIINKSSYDFDMWVQRGVDSGGFKGVFGVDLNTSNLNSFVGLEGIEKAFSSCGVAKGKGFSHKSVIYNIYCPKGTKMYYLEPFSQYGHGTRSVNWDGISKQSDFGSEAETLLQRDTKFRITKAEYKNGKYYIDLDVIGQ